MMAKSTRARWERLVEAGATLVMLLASTLSASGQEQSYAGVQLGIDVGRQHIFGGSLVDGMDVLAEVDRAVVSARLGLRAQFGPGIVLGVEGEYGRFDGNLEAEWRGTRVVWSGGAQTAFGIVAGWVLPVGFEPLLFGYLNEVSRDFDVTLSGPDGTGSQRDGQGMLRWGAGVEAPLGRFGVRATVGSGRADFGDAITNIEPTRGIDFAVGLLFRF